MATILVVDDSLTVRMNLAEALEAAGYRAIPCPDAEAARQWLQADRADLIILGMLPPDRAAERFLAELRGDPATAATPVIALGPAPAGEWGADRNLYTASPGELDRILDRVKQALGSAPETDAASAERGRRILAVDDSPTYLHALADELRKDGHEVISASSGSAALDILAEQSVDCVVLDLTMPGISGVETCRRIKSSPRWRDIPVLMLTAREDREAMIAAFDAGADDYIPKSSELQVLRARLRAQLRRQHFEEENRRMREELYQKEVEAAEARAARELAAMRAALLADLERKNAELQRTSEELRRAKESAEAANAAKDQFLAVLSHELRTPLTPVLAAVTYLAMRQDLPAQVRADIETIRRNVEMEARLIDDLLDLTRIARGKLELVFETVDAHEALHHAVEICRADMQEKGLYLTVELGARHHHVRADPARLQQVFWNLIKNAVKFTPRGGSITLRTGNAGPANGSSRPGDPGAGREMLSVEVIDTGVGIDPETLPRIFNAFEQGESIAGRRFGGLGLGLAISKALVDMHGGSLTAQSAGPGRGATFTVHLATVREAPARSPRSPAPQPAAAAGLKILLVEDHEDTLRILARLLRTFGHEVRTATGVQQAIDAAEKDRFDLLISDIGLPDGSGLDLMRRLRHQTQLRGIALSGFGMDQDLRNSQEAGFEQHLTKPVNIQALQEAVDRVAGELAGDSATG